MAGRSGGRGLVVDVVSGNWSFLLVSEYTVSCCSNTFVLYTRMWYCLCILLMMRICSMPLLFLLHAYTYYVHSYLATVVYYVFFSFAFSLVAV